MKVKDVSDKLLNNIYVGIEKHGFKLNKKSRQFTRINDGFKQIFRLLFYKYSDYILIEPVVIVKVKEIEDIYHKVASKAPEHFDGTKTIGNNLGKIIEVIDEGLVIDTNNKIKYLVENEQDVEILINVLIEKFENYALPYFNKNNSIHHIDEILNAYPSKISIHNSLYPMRACIAIIAAKLNNNPQYDELVSIYKEGLINVADFYKPEFPKLVELLKEY